MHVYSSAELEAVALTEVRKRKSLFDKCYSISTAIARRVGGRVVQFSAYQGSSDFSDPKWKQIPTSYWKHYAVRVGDTIVDATFSQFDSRVAVPLVQSLSEYARMWHCLYDSDQG